MRKAAGLPNVSALFLHKCDLLTDDGEAAEIVRTALQRAKRQSGDDDYRLRDLFSKKTWEQFSKGARLRAGRMFHQKIAAALDGIRATKERNQSPVLPNCRPTIMTGLASMHVHWERTEDGAKGHRE
jgi:Domain of unknown function (DUF1413)